MLKYLRKSYVRATEDDLNTLIDATKLFIKLIEENDKGDEV